MTVATAAPPRDAFLLEESVAAAPADALEICEADGSPAKIGDGNFPMVLIRPCVGKGRGRHVYGADMLQENADAFTGWKMYIDHLSPAARRAAGGLPRSVRDLGGRVVRSWWDASLAEEGRFGRGGVVSEIRPVPLLRELIENDPELLECSIRARATSVSEVREGGQSAYAVEGIEREPKGSVDFVTEGGAGGRVASLLESVYHSAQDEEMAMFESLTDAELVEKLKEGRPSVVTALQETPAAPAKAEEEEPTAPAKPKKKAEPEEEEPVKQKDSTEVLREALQGDEGKQAVRELFEAELEQAREQGRSEAEAIADRRLELRDMRDKAQNLIQESKLPEDFQKVLIDRYAITAGRPTQALNLLEETDDQGAVTKTAEEVLIEAVENDITEQRRLVAAANPTRVKGQGGSEPEGSGGGDGSDGNSDSLWRKGLEEAGVDPDKAYENV